MPRGRPKKVVTTPTELTQNLAALCYYAWEEPSDIGFEQRSRAEQQPWLERAASIVRMIGKLNLELIPKGTKPTHDDRRLKIDTTRQVIEELVRSLKSTRPEHFPAEELAHRIIERVVDGK
jgi:hypothetical protein